MGPAWICTISAQRLMVAPAMVAVIIPVAVGLLLGRRCIRTAGRQYGYRVVLAVMMANAGGAWDAAKIHRERAAGRKGQ